MEITIRDAGTGEAVVRRDLLQLGRNLADLQPGFEQAADIMRESVRMAFETEGASTGHKWDPLAESTRRQRAREKGLAVSGGFLRNAKGQFASDAHPILRVHDELYHSLVRKFDRHHIERASGDSLLFGSDVPYAKFHQSTLPRTRLPRRAPLLLTEPEKRAITRALHEASMRGVRGGRSGGVEE